MKLLFSKIKRRNLLQLLWVAPFFLLYKYLTPKEKKYSSIIVPVAELPNNGAYLIKDKKAGIVRDNNGIRVYSISCTHLGCVLNVEGDRFICPCHGSSFDLYGNVLKGPALTPLKKLNYKLKKEIIVIYL